MYEMCIVHTAHAIHISSSSYYFNLNERNFIRVCLEWDIKIYGTCLIATNMMVDSGWNMIKMKTRKRLHIV